MNGLFTRQNAQRADPMQETYDGELKDLPDSHDHGKDNTAANELVSRLGQGDFDTGAAVVNEFL